jgi:REP element-mobilizing transposase RayT
MAQKPEGECFAPTGHNADHNGQMKYDPAKHHRRSIRLQGYNYATPGAYFVTICTRNKECLLGEISAEGQMQLNDMGRMVTECWNAIPTHFPHITLDTYIVMPNHIHGIITLGVGAKHSLNFANASPLPANGTQSGSLGAIIQNFKSISTRKINAQRAMPGIPVWQRNYWERIVRDESELGHIRQYIANNPRRWAFDRANPQPRPA